MVRLLGVPGVGAALMGYISPLPPPLLNVDRFGLPRDYATYVWLLYGRRVEDRSPRRLAFTNYPTFGVQRLGPSRDTR